MTVIPRLSKSRFLSGLQCPKKLWWEVHEPDAPELTPDAGLQSIFDRGTRVGEAARAFVPGGVLIDLPHHEIDRRVAETRNALASGAPVIYEASFLEDGVFVAADILERRPEGFVLSEVKSTLDVKEQHIPDVAIQIYVVRRAGLPVFRAELMHLNRACRYPDLSNVFVREDVTAAAESLLVGIPERVRSLTTAVSGLLPEVATGPHCTTPYECPFLDRCWPALPEHHVSNLYGIRQKATAALIEKGYPTIADLPDDYLAYGPRSRQIRSVKSMDVIAEPGLREVLDSLTPPIAFLDFETIAPAIPVWPGCHPFDQVPVQFSCHLLGATGLDHFEWIADGPRDPREPFAIALIAACSGAQTILAYNAPFERRCVSNLIGAVPHLAPELERLSGRIRDLLPIVRDHVYHPDFLGSFSIKSVLPALVPEMSYNDLEIQGGDVAAAELETILLNASACSNDEASIRKALLRYCDRDTLAMVRVYERLKDLAGIVP